MHLNELSRWHIYIYKTISIYIYSYIYS
jgi:hypothetical protein